MFSGHVSGLRKRTLQKVFIIQSDRKTESAPWIMNEIKIYYGSVVDGKQKRERAYPKSCYIGICRANILTSHFEDFMR
jgi:hypothetical protein